VKHEGPKAAKKLSNQELYQPAALGISDVACEVPEELKAIMRENSRTLDEMMATKKALCLTSERP
jgi:hypothetical protein